MPIMKRLNHQRGFSLLEALFSMVVLSIAMLSIARMHALVTQDGGYSKARAIAVNLAQEKLDDLRSFTSINTGCATAGVFCFTEIVDNGGGDIASGDVTVGTTTYTRTWTLTDTTNYPLVGNYYRCGTTAPSRTNCAAPFTKAYPDFKVLVVLVTWTDEQGNNRSVLLTGNIYSSSLTAEANSIGAPYTGAGPDVSAFPSPENVPIEIGGGKSTETSKPLPEVSGGDSRRVTLPAIVYTGQVGSEILISQEEFTTVNCTCTLQASGTGWTPHRTVWNGSRLEQEYGLEVTKPVGVPSDLSMAGTTNQDELCIECCRDHHDTNADADGVTSGTQYYPSYRPYVPLTQFDSTSGDHKHYKADGSLAVVGEVYVESCRFKRIDGFWRVVQDWLLIEQAVYGCDYFAETSTYECPVTTNLSTTKQDIYTTWVKNVLQDFVDYMDTYKTTNTATTALPEFNSGVSPLLNTGNSAHDIYVNQGGNRQLISRAIYADVIFKRKGTGDARSVDQDYVAAVLPVTSGDFEKLQYIPFYDANMTLLAKWSPTSTNTAPSGTPKPGDCSPSTATIAYNDPSITTPSTHPVCVTSEAIDTVNDSSLNYYNDFYSRGKIYGKAIGSNLITAKIARGNNGLTSSPSINGTTDPVLERQVKAVVPSGTEAISGRVVRGNSGATLNYVTISASPSAGVTCSWTSPATLATASESAFNCTVPSGWVGTLTFGDTAPSVTYSYQPGATTATIDAPATVPDVYVYGGTASIRGRITGNDDLLSGVPRVNMVSTTVTFNGTYDLGGVNTTLNGTCTTRNPVTTSIGGGTRTIRLDYTCDVPVTWTGTVNVNIDESVTSSSVQHYYLSPEYIATYPYGYECNINTSRDSCTLLTIPPMIGDVDGTVAGALLDVRRKTNVMVFR